MTNTSANPTAADPRRVNVVGKGRHGHGYVFVQDGTWRIEHCQDGRWGACGLLIFGVHDDERAVKQAVVRHLARQPHRFEHPQALAGTHHGGGGRPVNGQWKKGPQP